jgi:hypothetical protein
MNKFEQGKLVCWDNEFGQSIVWVITQENKGVVVHSEGNLSVGTYMDIKDYPIKPFVGSVQMKSTLNK